jgi:DNA gyrase subunit A
LIRCPVDDVRIAGRNTQGVTIFKTEEDATVVSVARLGETSDDDEDEDTEEAGEIGEAGVEPSDDSAAEPQAGDE